MEEKNSQYEEVITDKETEILVEENIEPREKVKSKGLSKTARMVVAISAIVVLIVAIITGILALVIKEKEDNERENIISNVGTEEKIEYPRDVSVSEFVEKIEGYWFYGIHSSETSRCEILYFDDNNKINYLVYQSGLFSQPGEIQKVVETQKDKFTLDVHYPKALEQWGDEITEHPAYDEVIYATLKDGKLTLDDSVTYSYGGETYEECIEKWEQYKAKAESVNAGNEEYDNLPSINEIERLLTIAYSDFLKMLGENASEYKGVVDFEIKNVSEATHDQTFSCFIEPSKDGVTGLKVMGLVKNGRIIQMQSVYFVEYENNEEELQAGVIISAFPLSIYEKNIQTVSDMWDFIKKMDYVDNGGSGEKLRTVRGDMEYAVTCGTASGENYVLSSFTVRYLPAFNGVGFFEE